MLASSIATITTSSGGLEVPRARTNASRAASFKAGARHITIIAADVETTMMAIAHMIVRNELPMRSLISEIRGVSTYEERKTIINRMRVTGTRLNLSPSSWGGLLDIALNGVGCSFHQDSRCPSGLV